MRAHGVSDARVPSGTAKIPVQSIRGQPDAIGIHGRSDVASPRPRSAAARKAARAAPSGFAEPIQTR
jgi:hypothetical protein